MNAFPKTSLVLELYEQEPGLYVFELALPRGTAHKAAEAWGTASLLPALVTAGACNRWKQFTCDVPNEPNVLRCWVRSPTAGQLEALRAVLKEGVEVADVLFQQLRQQHEAEAAEKGAEFHNLGWAVTETGIASKTSRGILDSEIDPDTGEVTHTWS